MIYARRHMKNSRSSSEMSSTVRGNDIMHRRKRLAVGGCIFLLVLVIVSAIELRAVDMARYIIVIDSGSTGTRVYVYRWDERDGSMPRVTPLEPSLREVKMHRKSAGFKRGAYLRIETEPGLDRAAGDPTATRQALRPLLQWAEKTIPSASHSTSPVFLFGTAGLRRLQEDRRAALLSDLRQLLEASPFRFEPDWVQVIEGSDEGIFGWVGLNFVKERIVSSLGQQQQQRGEREGGGGLAAAKAVSYELDTVGSLDLGGSSLEVTFVPNEWPQATTDRVETKVLGTPYSVYTHSYKGYGMNDAFDKAVTILLDEQHNGGGSVGAPGSADAASVTVKHPCIQAGYDSSYRRKDLAWRPRVEAEGVRGGGAGRRQQGQERADADAPEQRLLDTVVNVRIVGDPDWERCRSLAAKVVDANAPCGHPPCSLGFQSPPSRGKFFAMSGFYVVYNFFKLPLTASLPELEDAGRQYCSRPWSSIQAEMSDVKNTEAYCFRAPFVSILLQDGLGILPSHVSIVEGGFSWTLGAAIAEGVRLAGLGSGGQHSPISPSQGLPGSSTSWRSPGYVKLFAAAFVLLAWAILAGSAVFQQGSWTRGLLGEGSGARASPAGASRTPGSPMRGGPPELRIPPQSNMGAGKAISSPPPMHRTPSSSRIAEQDFSNKPAPANMGRRRLEKSTNSLTQLGGPPE